MAMFIIAGVRAKSIWARVSLGEFFATMLALEFLLIYAFMFFAPFVGIPPSSSIFEMPNGVTIGTQQQNVIVGSIPAVSVEMMDLKYFRDSIKSAVLALGTTEYHKAFALSVWVGTYLTGKSTYPIISVALQRAESVSSLIGIRNHAVILAAKFTVSPKLSSSFTSKLRLEFITAFTVAILGIFVCRESRHFSARTSNGNILPDASARLPVQTSAPSRAKLPVVGSGARESNPTTLAGDHVGRTDEVPRQVGEVPTAPIRLDWPTAATSANLRTWISSVVRRVFPTWRVVLLSVCEHGLYLPCWPFPRRSVVFSCGECNVPAGFSQGA